MNYIKNRIKDKYNQRIANVNKNLNLVKSIANVPEYIQALKYGHNKDSYQTREILEPNKNIDVNSLEIVRQPLSQPLMHILSSFTGFQLEQKLKEQNYETLFHLILRINDKFDYEKSDASVYFRLKHNKPGQQYLKINPQYIPPGLTIGQLVENTKKYLGNAYYYYKGLKCNCQHFVLAILEANLSYVPQEYKDFIMQNTDEVFKSMPGFLESLMNTITDIYNRGQILQEGTGVATIKKYPNELSNFDIINICKKLNIPLKKVIMKNQLTMKNFKDGSYIMNLESSTQGSGTHWTAFIKKGSLVIYCDSFGVYPPQNEYNIFLKSSKDILINTKQFQAYKSIDCGWFAIMFLWYINNFGINAKTMINYLKIYNYKNLSINDSVKNLILHKLYIHENN